MDETLRVVLLLSPGAGYDRGLFRGIARYAGHYGPWIFLPFWEQRGMPQDLLMELDIQAASLRQKHRRPNSMAQTFKRLGVRGIIGRLAMPEIIEAVFALDLPTVGMDLSDEQTGRHPFYRAHLRNSTGLAQGGPNGGRASIGTRLPTVCLLWTQEKHDLVTSAWRRFL